MRAHVVLHQRDGADRLVAIQVDIGRGYAVEAGALAQALGPGKERAIRV